MTSDGALRRPAGPARLEGRAMATHRHSGTEGAGRAAGFLSISSSRCVVFLFVGLSSVLFELSIFVLLLHLFVNVLYGCCCICLLLLSFVYFRFGLFIAKKSKNEKKKKS